MNRLRILIIACLISLSWIRPMTAQDLTTPPQQVADTISFIPYYATQILIDETLGAHLSPEAREVIGRPMVIISTPQAPEGYAPFSQLLVPLVFDISKLKDIKMSSKTLRTYTDNPYKVGETLEEYAQSYMSDELAKAGKLSSLIRESELISSVRSNTLRSRSNLIKVSSAMLPQDRLASQTIDGIGYQGELAINKVETTPGNTAMLERKEVKRVYWTQNFESDIHFSQNQVSDNWYKGGKNSLNLHMRNYLNISYSKNTVKWVNEIESKLGFYLSAIDPKDKINISEDLFRIVSNFGLKAREHWYYTIDVQFRTQLLKNTKSNGELITKTFAPITMDGGPGMKYELDKRFKDRFKRLKFSANISPVAVSFIYTYANDIDKARIGLSKDENYKLRLGSTVRATLNFNISQTVSWQSRFFYNTSFKHVETEWENNLSIALTRHFSTRLNLQVRFDDSVITNDKSLRNLLQYNELISFGFSYRI